VLRGLQQTTILYVEDHDLVLFTVKQLLELEGWRVRVCRDGSHALKQIAGEEHFDLIILDAELPAVSGFDLIRRARALAHREATPIVMFSALDCGDDAISAGADACLKKPGGIKDLLDTCYRVMNHSPADESNGNEPLRAANGAGNSRH
jgi:DNA-binding response OmpR family regulator